MSRMHTVRAEHRQLSKTELRTRTARTWHVLPACEGPFKRELNIMATLHDLVGHLSTRPWWVRFDHSHLVLRGQFLYRRRNEGFWPALKTAVKVAIVFSAPEKLSEWLTKRWKPKQQPASPTAVPKVVPAPLCDSSPAPR